MKLPANALKEVSWLRIVQVIVLTTIATAIIWPYFFGFDKLPFFFLWVRLFVVAVVMLIAYVATDVLYANIAQPRLKLMHAQFIALVIGALLGTIVSGLLIGRSLTQMFTNEPMIFGMVVFTAVSISLGVLTATVLVYREQAARSAMDVAQAEAQRHELEKQVLEARLKLMQAQIEPHFLFNTLANVQHLVEADPPLAGRTLESLITYLRAALPEMREGATNLGREAAMARAYLEIQEIRMGKRLRFQVDVPDSVRTLVFPPMMLLTLIENALKHGIDPLQQGGEIKVSAEVVDGLLQVSVADTGQGLLQSNGMGVGLENIRERLRTLYGKSAKLCLEENSPRGVVARITVPYAYGSAARESTKDGATAT